MDFCALKVGEPEGLVRELAPRLRLSRTVEEACSLLCGELYERCRSGVEAERTLVLSRVYLSLPFPALDPGDAAFARDRFGLDPQPTDLFLTLVGTRGDRAEWCDRRRSQGHRAIPLNRHTVAAVPMVARCFQQIGFDLDLVLRAEKGIHLQGVARAFGLFHVEDARESPYVPAQEDFVKPCGVRTALGCGTMLPDGAVSIWIGFSRHPIARAAALPLVVLMPEFWAVTHPLYRKGAFFVD